AENAENDALGTVKLSATPSPRVRAERPEATTMLGYELKVIAKNAGKEAGSTKVRLGEGAVPPLRRRATARRAKAGETGRAELVRGPDFSGDLPEKLWLQSPKYDAIEAKVNVEKRTVEFPLPKDADGWWSVETSGAVARVFVRGGTELAVNVAPDKEKYAP